MKKKKYLITIVVILAILLLIGIISSRETKWTTFTDSGFSISYPQMKITNSTAPNILTAGNFSCNIMINKLPNQSDVVGAANFFKAELNKSSLVTVLSQRIGSAEANFELRAIYNKKPYNSKMKVVTCSGNIYQILSSCTESSYPKQAENIGKTLDSVKCSD